jgi:hypothetical protein
MMRVLVCHPSWEKPQQIACIRSDPRRENSTRHDDAQVHSGDDLSCSLASESRLEDSGRTLRKWTNRILGQATKDQTLYPQDANR